MKSQCGAIGCCMHKHLPGIGWCIPGLYSDFWSYVCRWRVRCLAGLRFLLWQKWCLRWLQPAGNVPSVFGCWISCILRIAQRRSWHGDGCPAFPYSVLFCSIGWSCYCWNDCCNSKTLPAGSNRMHLSLTTVLMFSSGIPLSAGRKSCWIHCFHNRLTSCCIVRKVYNSIETDSQVDLLSWVLSSAWCFLLQHRIHVW